MTTMTTIGESRGRRGGLNLLGTQESPTVATATARPIAVYTSFVVSPSEIDAWIETWKRLARTAEKRQGCRSFRIIQDRNDRMFVAAMSEWDDIEVYNRFVHQTLGASFSRVMGPTCTPSECRFMDIIDAESAPFVRA